MIAAIRVQMNSGASSENDQVQALAMQWKKLFEASATGGDPEITERMRLAYEREPLLIQGTGIDQELLEFVRQTMDKL